ncbi:MAG: carboxylesterase family protein [Acidobacteriota bacterium]
MKARIHPSILLPALVAFTLPGCSPAQSPRPAPRAEIDGERLEGAYFGSGTNEVVFKGIPYAAPPLGARRWKPPMPIQPRQGVQTATQFAPACPQPAGPEGNLEWYREIARAFGQDPAVIPPMVPMSEDCLYLNVWTAHWGGEMKQPVMVWIHGGGNYLGWGHEPPYHGKSLARRGVVMVSINYRLGEFGFLAHPHLTQESPNHSSGNYGLLDQIEALRWVQRNIAAFGGDPARVTIFGESAGAADVGYLMASPLAAGLFHRAISQSGGYLLDDFRTLGFEEARGVQLAMGLGIEDGEGTLASLRAKSTNEILAAAAQLPSKSSTYGPNIDGLILPDSPARIFAEGRQHAVPLMIGANANEWTLFGSPPDNLAQYNERIRSAYGNLAAEAMGLYAAAAPEDIAANFDRWKTDDTFLCGSKLMARSMSLVRSDAYVYHFTRVLPGPGGNRLGAFHGAEIPYVFDTPDAWLPWEEADESLAEQMAAYWVQFATAGDPNREGLPHWPPCRGAAQRYLELGAEVRTGAGLHRDACALYEAKLAASTRTSG